MSSRKPHHLYYDAAGWVGALLLVGAYGLYSLGMLNAVTMQFQAMNAVGSLGLFVYALHKKAWPPAVVFVAWGALAAYGLYAYFG